MNSKSKTALITGSGKNIGRGVALGLAKDGFDIVVNGVSNEAAVEKTVNDIKALGVEAIGVMADIGDPDGLSGLIKDAMDAFGGVDVLVNNAAIRPSAGFIEMSDEDWMRVMNVNFGSVHGLSKAFLPGMVERGHGRIITISSAAGTHGVGMGFVPYSVGKGGSLSLMRSLALEHGRDGITANSVALGIMDSVRAETAAALTKAIPVGRLGSPDDVGAACLWLASDEAGWVTGQTIGLNGGAFTS